MHVTLVRFPSCKQSLLFVRTLWWFSTSLVTTSFSSFGDQVVRFCLQKNPKERPNCASLLSKKFFKRDLQPDGIVKELLVNVPVVGEGDGALERKEPGCVRFVVLVWMSGVCCSVLHVQRTRFSMMKKCICSILFHEALQMECASTSTRCNSFSSTRESTQGGYFFLLSCRNTDVGTGWRF